MKGYLKSFGTFWMIVVYQGEEYCGNCRRAQKQECISAAKQLFDNIEIESV